MKKGERAGAILGADGDVVEFFGYGIYNGEEVPKEASGLLGKMLTSTNMKNPCILLDNGKKVYGCECWWGPEEQIKERLGQYKEVRIADIDEVRNQEG